MVANGNTDRLLFLLHGSVLDILQDPKSEADCQKRDMSWIGLEIVCRMIVDVAQWDGEEKASMMPIGSFYNLRTARKHLEERNKLVADEILSRDIDSLLKAEEEYRKTWVL